MNPILLMSVLAILVPAGSPGLQTTTVAMTGSGLSISGGCPGNPGVCEFTLAVSNPTLQFFRWDRNGDGRWDYPFQGDSQIGTWDSETEIYFPVSSGGPLKVCAQAWDGTSMVHIGPNWVPRGPIACKNLLLGGDFSITPATWDRASTGAVFASWKVPDVFVQGTSVPDVATIADLPATSVPTMRIPGRSVILKFEVDRTALTMALGVGTHYVRLWGILADTPLSVWGGVEFSADSVVTIT